VEVDTLAGIGPLAQRTGAAVVPVIPYRDENGVVHVRFEPAIDLGLDRSDSKKVTQLLANKVEQWVREKPEQWLWVHRRFKNVRWPNQ
jgi:KDO2-lipid IV(A) lauroyltransferase